MALTPIDVQQKTFGTALRGYDLDEVDDFLDEVVTTLKSYEERLVESQERIAALQAELEGKGDSESAISRALVTAQRSADALVAEAHSDAERTTTEAKAEADRILAEATAERAQLEASRIEAQSQLDAELAGMREKIAAIRARVLDLNTSIESNLDEMDLAVTDGPVIDSAESVDESAPEGDSDEESPASAPPVDDTADPVVIAEVSEPVAIPDAADITESDDAPWYEASSDHEGDQELDFDLDDDDEMVITADEPIDADSDPLDEAIAEATFQSSNGDVEPDDGWAPSDSDGEASAQEAVEEIEEDTGEPWEEVWGSEDDDRPRRPWE